MEIRNSTHIAASADEVWASLTAIEEVASCIPGATVTERLADDRYAGEVRVKVGPLGLTLGGEVVVDTIDDAERSMRLRMSARDRRGLGQVTANVTLQVRGSPEAADLEIVTDATLQGPVAQFGRQGIVDAISTRLLGEFARCLEGRLARPAVAPPA
jgi:carbon monoxide dehydrogenase subunit G